MPVGLSIDSFLFLSPHDAILHSYLHLHLLRNYGPAVLSLNIISSRQSSIHYNIIWALSSQHSSHYLVPRETLEGVMNMLLWHKGYFEPKTFENQQLQKENFLFFFFFFKLPLSAQKHPKRIRLVFRSCYSKYSTVSY